MNLKQTFGLGRAYIVLIAAIGLFSDIIYSTGFSKYSALGVPLELAVLFHFGYRYGKAGNGLLQCVIASILVVNMAMILNSMAYAVILFAGVGAGILPGLTPEIIISNIIENTVFAIALFSIAGCVTGASASLIGKRL